MMSEKDAQKRLLFGGIFVAIGLVAIAIGVVQFIGQVRTSSWPTTRGVITTSGVVRFRGSGPSPDSFRSDISYQYEVAGKLYDSDRVRFGQVSTSSSDDARRLVSRYPAGAPVTVYYNPADPGDAVLESGATGEIWFLPAFGVVFAAFGAAVLAGLMRIPSPAG